MSTVKRRGNQGGVVAAAFVTVILCAATAFWVYSQFRIEVPREHIAILIHKTGKDLQPHEEIATSEEYKGVQLGVLSEGRHFRNPYFWDWDVVKQQVIPEGKLGVRIRLHGDDLGYGQFLATEPNQKGIVAEVLRPGRYPINTYAEKVEIHDPKTVPAGYKGVVINLAGPIPENPNTLLVDDGFRGVQKTTLEPETYYVNPYVKRIHLVDCRSQRIDLSEDKDLGFPSKDGFWVSLEGISEFAVRPERAAEVFVTYNENNDDDIIDEIRTKIILPNARSFCRLEGSKSLGRELIQGETRKKFEDNFQQAMRDACEPLGVEIIQALITRIQPPEKIAVPVRSREIAKQEELQYKQQILQQESEKQLAIEKALVAQKQALVQAAQEIVKVTTEAQQKQEVAVTKANERREVGKLALQAAADEAIAIRARGKAAAEVVHFNNRAEAAGWQEAVSAFSGDGNAYARFVLFQKLAPAYRSIMANTADSPIMEIFRAFAEHPGQVPAPGPNATASLSPRGEETQK